MGWVGVELEYQKERKYKDMIKYVGTHVLNDNVKLENLLTEGYSHITEHGYAISYDEEISTDDISIEYALCCLYDSIEENNIDIN